MMINNVKNIILVKIGYIVLVPKQDFLSKLFQKTLKLFILRAGVEEITFNTGFQCVNLE